MNRLYAIRRMLEENSEIKVSSLAKQLNVSEKTIRVDLEKLEDEGFIQRVHGGAVLVSSYSHDYYLATRKGELETKKRLAQKAYEYINDGDSIFLDSGSTTYELAKILNKKVIVLTNDPYIAAELQSKENVILYSTGGRLKRARRNIFTYVGAEAIRMIRSFSMTKFFLSTSAFNFDQGCMVYSAEEMEVKRAAMASTQQHIALIDHTKFNTSASCPFANCADINVLITDSRITKEEIKEAEKKGIQLEIV